MRREASRGLALDGPFAAAEGGGGLGDVEVLPEPQDDHGSLPRRHRGEGGEEREPLVGLVSGLRGGVGQGWRR